MKGLIPWCGSVWALGCLCHCKQIGFPARARCQTWRGKGSHCHLQILWLSASFCISCGCRCGIHAYKSTRWSAWSTALPWESKSSPGFTTGQVTHSCRNSVAAAFRWVSKQGGGGGRSSWALLGCAHGCTFLGYRFVQADPQGPPSHPCCPLLH